MSQNPIEYATLIILLLLLSLVASMAWEFRRRRRTRVEILPMSSSVPIKSNKSAQITSQPQQHSLRPERIIIGGDPADWIVNDVKIHGLSQFAQSGDVPGEMFSAGTIDGFTRFDVVDPGRNFQIVVTYIGQNPDGAPFVCGVIGAVVPSSAWIRTLLGYGRRPTRARAYATA
jgi:hypothetical protein